MKLRDTKKILILILIPKKIVLISLKNNIKTFKSENLGAKFFNLIKSSKDDEFYLNSMVISSNLKVMIGYFLHGLKLKSYIFEKYKSKKNKKNIKIIVIGKKIPSAKDQIKFKARRRLLY